MQYTCSHHVVSKPRFSKYNYNSISNRNGHQPASHDTRLHANRGLATITKKRYKWRSTFEIFERFSNDRRKTETKAITPTNHNRSRQRDEPITVPSNYLKLAQSAGKITRTWRDWFWFCFSLVENLAPITKRSNRNHVITFDRKLL